MYCVYLLKSWSKEETSIGSSNNLENRFIEHNLGKVKSTKRYRPWQLLYYEAYIEEKLARLREQRLKNNGNALRELKKRVGLIKEDEGLVQHRFSKQKSGKGLPSTTFVKQAPNKSGAGFTLIEILVVMGLLAIIGSFALVVNMDAWRGYNFRGDRDLLISVLQRARSQSVSNICLGSACTDGQRHGVAILPGKYVIFQGDAYNLSDPLNENIKTNNALNYTGSTISEVVFQQLSGDVSAPGDIVISDAIRTATIFINNEGRIDY